MTVSCRYAVDVDECAENLHDCDESFRASCTNTDGSYSCQCKAPLYEGNGHLCNSKTCHFKARVSIPRFYFIHLIFHSDDYNIPVEDFASANLCLVILLISEECS